MEQTNIKPETLKIEFREEVRRIPLTSDSYKELEQQIISLLSIEAGSFKIKYRDDEGDLIMLSSELEYQEALRCAEASVLRIKIEHLKRRAGFHNQNNNCGKKRHCHRNRRRHHGRHQHRGNPLAQLMQSTMQQGPQQLSNFFQQVAPLLQNCAGQIANGGKELDNVLKNVLNSDFVRVEHNHICDGCESKISGTRHHCKDCADFDFCDGCFEKLNEKHFGASHSFEKIGALEAVKEALKQGAGSIEAFFAPGKAKQAKQAVVHNAICDKCDKRIVGKRYKCVDRADFDLCESCFGEEKMGEHSFAELVAVESKEKIQEIIESVKQSRQEDEKRKRMEEIEEKKKALEEKQRKEREAFEAEVKKIEGQMESTTIDQWVVIDENKQQPKEEVKEEVEEEEEEQKIVYPFEDKLQSLVEMGFLDRNENIQVLVKNKGSVLASIQELLNN